MNDTIKEDLLQTYPQYNGKKYTLNWETNDAITITSYLGKEYTLKYTYDQLALLLNNSLPIEEAIDDFVYQNVPMDIVEAGNCGSLVYSVATNTWQIGSMRPNGSIKYVFWSSFSDIDKQLIGAKWTSLFNVEDFVVTHEDLLLEIESKKTGTTAVHCLQSQELIATLLDDYYDLSLETEVLLTDDYTSIIVGHKKAIERLYIPGRNNCRKSYQDIHHEIWSSNAT